MYTLYNRECKIPVKNTEENKLKLLVVEDEKKLCEMIAKSLHRAGYEVDTCNDGEKALDMIYAEMYGFNRTLILTFREWMEWRFSGNFAKKMKKQRY